MTPEKQRMCDLLRAALRETTGAPRVDDLLRASFRASFGDDPDLERVFRVETTKSSPAGVTPEPVTSAGDPHGGGLS